VLSPKRLLAPGFWLLRLFLDPLGKNIRVMADGTPHVACDSHAQGFAEAVQKAAALRLLSGALLVTPHDFADQERIIRYVSCGCISRRRVMKTLSPNYDNYCSYQD
jgi:hypothetical protein